MAPAKTTKPVKKRATRKKKQKDVLFDVSEISTAIMTIAIKDQKVCIVFQGQEKEYIYNYSEDLTLFVKEIEKFVSAQHLSLGRYFNTLVKDGKLTQNV
jgi:glutamine amidotransferase-like uncharacterized protein